MKLNLIIPAAGFGKRFKGAKLPKQFLAIQGMPLVYHTLLAFKDLKPLTRIIIATQKSSFRYFRPDILKKYGLKNVKVVAGGKERVDSVRNALKALERDADYVMIHDAARPFIHKADIQKVLKAAKKSGAAILARSVIPTIKSVNSKGLIQETINRNLLRSAETPQVFKRKLILKAHKSYQGSKKKVTDDAYLVEQMGKKVVCVTPNYPNLKVTNPEDLNMTKEKESSMNIRIGNGYDIHRLVIGKKLMLGGVEVPSERGCLGHSDGDVLIHAIIDSLLGTIGTKDIGEYFPDTRKTLKNISSLVLLDKVRGLLKKNKREIVNVDTTIVCERPKLADYKKKMQKNIAKCLGIDPEKIGIKAKTNEGLDSQGQGFSISAYAVALVKGAD